ncbi:hypothetical protein BCR33DRAFT_729657 [Rhizoclosmatium globosum]|uniref:F-box domain-containing protein n=1 Tax=Rhizoclosmatium globosum TaxID=329046 RepID=A0A1Y2AEY8_9FUNG|nr:hypothetical protein BCR33DRAFT_729657 [Rhizoclosmatium globosum]|eukprot:ORY21032.1 hypothetical protein BCR33DRAFT_729657 [Rhizoclosmatium globosum]
MTLYMRSIPVIVEHCAAVEALGTLISRFNGTTCFDIPMGFPLDQIENMCNVSSKKVMVMFGPVDSSAYYELAKHISRSGKTVVEIYLGHILSNITVDDIERVREALVVLDPLDITWFGDDIILPALYSCTRVYRLHLENIFCNSICISSILANMKSLKEISVAHLNKKMLLDLIRMLPSTNVQKLMLPGLDRDLKVWELRKLMEEAGYENRWPKHEQTGWYRCSAKKWK